jgi:hypothetical protein
MEISYGNKRVLKVFRQDKCVSIGIPKSKLLLHLDSIGMENTKLETRNKFYDISGNNNHFNLYNFDFNDENGWLENNLHFNGETTYIENYTFNTINVYTISISFHVPPNGNFAGSFPGINKVYTNNGTLYINVSSSSKISLNSVIKPNKFYNLIMTYEAGRFTVYLNGEKRRVYSNVNKGYVTNFCLGRSVDFTYGEFMLHSVQYYSKALTAQELKTLSDLEQKRYIVYYDKNMVMDVRGYNSMLKYGGFISIRDNSIHHNHLRCSKWYTHFPKTRSYAMTGTNSMNIVGRPLLMDSFTLEFVISHIKYMFAEEVFLMGKYKKGEYGIEITLNVRGLILRIHGKTQLEYLYPINYTNKRTSISIVYDRKNQQLILYHNANRVKLFENVDYISNINDMTMNFARKDGYFPFIGNICCIRMYNEAISSSCINDNYEQDMDIYRQ